MDNKIRCKIADRDCKRKHDCTNDYCQILFTNDLGFITDREPEEDDIYLCRLQFYKNEDETIIAYAEYLCKEWKITDTWNLLGWKEIK